MLKSYHQPPNSGEKCSTPRSRALRRLRFDMAYQTPQIPPVYEKISREALSIVEKRQAFSPSAARAEALAYVVGHSPVELCEHSIFLGGENPFFYNLMFEALVKDAFGSSAPSLLSGVEIHRQEAFMTSGICFDGHITPGCDFILQQGTQGLRRRISELSDANSENEAAREYEAMLSALDSIERYADRLSAAAGASEWEDIREAGKILENVPKKPAETFREALQSYWIIHTLITLEIGGCCPGGGIGLGRPDQYLYPYYAKDIENGVLTKKQALEYAELFLLNFRHNDYYTPHQMFTPGTHGSLCGITPAGADATNDLSLVFMEASLRIQMPAPYLSVRLNKKMSEKSILAASDYITGGLGFPVVNDEVLIPAFLRHGRSQSDANDYICSCCYENTIPGRESFNPNGFYYNLASVLECFLNGGGTINYGKALLGEDRSAELSVYGDFGSFFSGYLHHVKEVLAETIKTAGKIDAHLKTRRSYPLMSMFIEDCISKGKDVCAGGARYNLTGIIVSGLTNTVNALSAVNDVIFEKKAASLSELSGALRGNFEGYDSLRTKLLAAPKWGNGDAETDSLAARITDALYDTAKSFRNARGGRYQLALYSFCANIEMGRRMGASADGRLAGQVLTRNLNPTPGTDKNGPTEILRSLSVIDMTKFVNGTSLDLRFDPTPYQSEDGRKKFADFLRGMMELGVMQIQCSFADTETLLDARKNPRLYPDLMVKVAGYSARFVDLSDIEKDELIARTSQRLKTANI